MSAHGPYRYALSVLVADRVGILRDIISALTDLGASINGISQTVVEEYFTVIMTACFERPVEADTIRDAILAHFGKEEASVLVRPYVRRARGRPPEESGRYVVTIMGEDQAWLLKVVTTFLAEKDINIEDWYVHFDGRRVTHFGEVRIPDRLDVKQVQDEFRERLGALGLTSSIQHENIFKVTGEVGAVRPLLGEASHAANG